MKITKTLFTATLGVALSANLSALTLDECRDLSLDNYPLLKQHELIEKSEQYTINVAKSAWMPQLMLSAQATYQSDVPTYPVQLTDLLKEQGADIEGMQKGQYKLQAEVRQMIYDGGKTKHARRNTFLTSNEQKAALEVELRKVEQRVDELYFAILIMKKQQEAVANKERVLNTNLDTLKKSNTASQSDTDALTAELLCAKQQRQNIEANINTYKQMLSLFIGKDAGDDFTLPEPKNEEGEDLRLKMLQIDAKEAMMQNEEQGIKVACRPQVYIFGQLFCGYPGLDYLGAIENNDFTFNALLGIRASWNISSFYSLSDRRAGFQAKRDIMNLHRETLKFNADINRARIKSEIEQLKAMQADDKKIVELRESVRKASEERLRKGTATTIELMQRINEETAARINADTHAIEAVKKMYQQNTITER